MGLYTRRPHPLFAGPESMILDVESYYERYPCVAAYLKSFAAELNVERDFKWGVYFLSLHNRVPGTFNSYRNIVERILLWSWIFRKKSALMLNRDEFGQFISFCKNPPLAWVGVAHLVRFVLDGENWEFNDGWRPFKLQSELGSNNWKPFPGTLRQIQSVCSSFYNYLHAEDAVGVNPVIKSRLNSGSRDKSNHPARHFFSSDQIFRIMEVIERRADGDPVGERALFLVASMVYMCLRTADFANYDEYCPCMDSFVLCDGEWWLVLNRQGTALLRVKVNSNFLPYLERYRKSRGLTPMPATNEGIPILETAHGLPGLSIRHICAVVRAALRQAYEDIREAGDTDDQWNLLLRSNPSLLRDSGARILAQTRNPVDLQQDLGSMSLAYTYARYYND